MRNGAESRRGEATAPYFIASNTPKAAWLMRNDFSSANVRQLLSLTEFHVLGSQDGIETSRVCLAESQRRIMTSQRVIAKSDVLISALRSALEPSDDEGPRADSIGR